jgi:hypothetical protein
MLLKVKVGTAYNSIGIAPGLNLYINPTHLYIVPVGYGPKPGDGFPPFSADWCAQTNIIDDVRSTCPTQPTLTKELRVAYNNMMNTIMVETGNWYCTIVVSPAESDTRTIIIESTWFDYVNQVNSANNGGV